MFLPVQNIDPTPNVCFTCKNIDNLRSLALCQEIQLISDRIQDLQKVSANLEKINGTLADKTLVKNNILPEEGKIANQKDNMKKAEDELKELAKSLEYHATIREQSKTYASIICASKETTPDLSPNSTSERKSLPTSSTSKYKSYRPRMCEKPYRCVPLKWLTRFEFFNGI